MTSLVLAIRPTRDIPFEKACVYFLSSDKRGIVALCNARVLSSRINPEYEIWWQWCLRQSARVVVTIDDTHTIYLCHRQQTVGGLARIVCMSIKA
jgi:hypothetical protein